MMKGWQFKKDITAKIIESSVATLANADDSRS